MVPLIFFVIGMVADKRRVGKVHAAWFVGAAALVGSQLVTDAIAYSPAGYAITRAVVAGTPARGGRCARTCLERRGARGGGE